MTYNPVGSVGVNNNGYGSVIQPTAGGVLYSDGTLVACSIAGSAGQVLQSNGTAAPNWVDASGGGGQTPTENQYYYVAGNNGNDVTGDGTYNNPFATIAHAMGLITTAGANNRFIIKIIASKLQEPTNINLKPYVYIVGDHQDASYIRINGGAGSLVPDASWNFNGGARSGVQNIYFGGGSSVNWDLHSIGPNVGTPSCNLEFVGVTVTGNMTYNGRVPDIDFFQSYNTYIFGTTNFDALQNNSTGTTFEGATVFSSTNAASDSQVLACSFLTSLSLTASATYNNVLIMTGCGNVGSLTLTDAGSYIALQTDVASYPKHADVTITGSPVITLLNDAYALGYTPAVSGNWSVVPTTVQTALDRLAAKVGPV